MPAPNTLTLPDKATFLLETLPAIDRERSARVHALVGVAVVMPSVPVHFPADIIDDAASAVSNVRATNTALSTVERVTFQVNDAVGDQVTVDTGGAFNPWPAGDS